MNTSKAFTTLSICLLIGMFAISAHADEFTLGLSSQRITLTGEAGGTLDMALGSCGATSCTLTGTAPTTDGETATWSFVTTLGSDLPDFGPNNGAGMFPLSATDGTTSLFTFTDLVDGDSSVVNIPVTYVAWIDGSSNLQFEIRTPLSSALDIITLQNESMVVGGLGLTCSGLPVGEACSLANVALNPGSTASAGTFTGATVPESPTFTLLSLALLGLILHRSRILAMNQRG